MRMLIHNHEQTYICACSCTNTDKHVCQNMCMLIHEYEQKYAYKNMHIPIQRYAHTLMHVSLCIC